MKLTPANCRVEREAADVHGPSWHPSSPATGHLVREVPKPVQHLACMWPTEDGGSCGKTPIRWTYGTALRNPRFYCDEHGKAMSDRITTYNRRAMAAKNKRKKAKGNGSE